MKGVAPFIFLHYYEKIILIELTVPWAEGCGEAHERKMSKYQELLE